MKLKHTDGTTVAFGKWDGNKAPRNAVAETATSTSVTINGATKIVKGNTSKGGVQYFYLEVPPTEEGKEPTWMWTRDAVKEGAYVTYTPEPKPVKEKVVKEPKTPKAPKPAKGSTTAPAKTAPAPVQHAASTDEPGDLKIEAVDE